MIGDVLPEWEERLALVVHRVIVSVVLLAAARWRCMAAISELTASPCAACGAGAGSGIAWGLPPKHIVNPPLRMGHSP